MRDLTRTRLPTIIIIIIIIIIIVIVVVIVIIIIKIIVVVIIIIIITFIHGDYNYIPETNQASSFADILSLQFMVHVMSFPMWNVSYFYISIFLRSCYYYYYYYSTCAVATNLI